MHLTIEINGDTPPTELSRVIAMLIALGGAAPAGATVERGTLTVPLMREDPAAAFGAPDLAGLRVINDAGDGQPNATPPAVDATGLPWDARIHAETKATNKDGSWRGRRGVDEATVAAVTAELRGATVPPSPADTGGNVPPPPPAATVPPPAATVPPPPPPAESAPTASPAAGATTALNPFVRIVNDANAAKLGYDVLDPVAHQLGLEKFSKLAGHHDLIPTARMMLGLPA